MIFNTAKFTHQGGREINEDSMLCKDGLWIVADGLGGHADGEKASAEAVKYFEENCNGGYTDELVNELLEGANSAVGRLEGTGRTTVAAAFAENGIFRMANAGDSRVYYFRNGKIIAQTKDHSVSQASVDMGIITADDIRTNEDRSSLLKVLGNEERLNIKKRYPAITIQSGDSFLLCSDGFWEYVLESEMEADLLKSDNAEAWLSHMLKRHMLRAENKGDNYTAVCGFICRESSDDVRLPRKKVKLTVIIAAAVAVLAIAAALIIPRFIKNDAVTVEETGTTIVADEPEIEAENDDEPSTEEEDSEEDIAEIIEEDTAEDIVENGVS